MGSMDLDVRYGGRIGNITRAANFACRGREKATGPWETYDFRQTVSAPDLRGITDEAGITRLLENAGHERARQMGSNCRFVSLDSEKKVWWADFVSSYMCEDVYKLQGKAAEYCKNIMYDNLVQLVVSWPAPEKVKGCQLGAVYLGGLFTGGREMAEKCAKQLSQETGRYFYVETEHENISDGLPPTVITVHHHIRGGYQISLEESMKIYSNVTGHPVFSPLNKY